jgi:fatty acid-binding protein DegV
MSLCILTNTSALFPPISTNSGRFLRAMTLETNGHSIILPGVDDFNRTYSELEREFNAILVLTAAESILPLAATAQAAAQSHGGRAKIEILDTKQIGPGLGILTQLAARKAALGASLQEVTEYMRAVIPYLFTIFSPDHFPAYDQQTYDRAGEQTSAQPVFSLEEGLLVPYKKVRTQRHMLEILQEFLGEFEKPQHLAYFHGMNVSLHARPLREAAGGLFSGIHFNDLDLNPTLTTLFGEHTVGLSVLEMPGDSGL